MCRRGGEPAAAVLYRLCLDLLAEECRRYAVAVWACCLLPNHAPLVTLPSTVSGLAAVVGETHQRYTMAVNRRMGWTGQWQTLFWFGIPEFER